MKSSTTGDEDDERQAVYRRPLIFADDAVLTDTAHDNKVYKGKVRGCWY